MVFIVVEIQSNNETATALNTSFDNRNEAESKFHDVLRYAAVSNVTTHSAILLTDTGKVLKSETYKHESEETE